MSGLDYIEKDEQGRKTLEVIKAANRFNYWMYSTIKPFCKGRILEIGSGIGNISRFFIEDSFDINVSDIRPEYIEYLKSEYPISDSSCAMIDIAHPNFKIEYEYLKGAFDTVVALNIIEHVKEDSIAVENCRFLLKKGGTLVILVPAYRFLYNSFDRELKHFRRYSGKSVRLLLKGSNLKPRRIFHFNLAGIFGWFWSGNVLKKSVIPGGQMKFFNRIVPLFKIADLLTFRRIGLSVIGVAIKD